MDTKLPACKAGPKDANPQGASDAATITANPVTRPPTATAIQRQCCHQAATAATTRPATMRTIVSFTAAPEPGDPTRRQGDQEPAWRRHLAGSVR